MFGVDPKPLSLAALDVETHSHYYSVLEWIREMELMGGCVNEEAEENLEMARDWMKRAYDKGKIESGSGAGDLILLKKHNRKSGLDPHFKGPYPVLRRKGPNVLIQQEDTKGRKVEKWVHLNRCKRFIPDPGQLPVILTESHVRPSTETRDQERYSTDVTESEEYESDIPDEFKLSGTEPTDVPLRKSERMRKPSRKFLEAQWSNELSDDSYNRD